MKKHKMEIAALTLLLGVLCYAFYDSNIKGSEQEVVLSNELLSMREIKSKEDITMEMLSLPTEELLKQQDEKVKKESDTKTTEEVQVETYEEVTSEKEVYSINLAANSENEVPYNEIISNQVVNYALKFVGGPYVYGGNSLTNGTDCSGFTKLVFANYGVYLPRSAPEQAYAGVHVDLGDIKPGDIIVSGYDGVVCHAALYIGDGKLVHALNSNVGIVVTSMYIMPIIDVRRVA
ncbi:MAG: C40 family peptidase [Bacilli bacterium]|nr:C40 family peptidase [Bacilli bacterium]